MSILKLLTIFWLVIISLNIYAQQWDIRTVGEGAKPSIAVDSNNLVHIAYMLEADAGWVRHALLPDDESSFQITEVSEGYFYGPLDLDIDTNNFPHIVYHDHDVEDQMHYYLSAEGWIADRVANSGHDGWDNSIFIDKNNHIHTSTVDPSSFNGPGVEYSYYNGSNWSVQAIGSGPLMYANTTCVSVDDSGTPHITYYNDSTEDLMYARKDNGSWIISIIDSSGDAGQFASLVLDNSGYPNISYFKRLGTKSGSINFARWDGSNWLNSTIDTLKNVAIGFAGARNMISLVLDSGGQLHLAYSDQKILKYAKLIDDEWIVETVLDLSTNEKVLGQLTSLALDAGDNAHVTYYEVTTTVPLTGTIKYITNKNVTSTDSELSIVKDFNLFQNYPNPFNPSTTIGYSLPGQDRSGESFNQTTIKIYDMIGKEVTTLVNEQQSPGRYEIRFEAIALPSGVYFYQLEYGVYRATKKMLLIK